jgi:predicted ATPase
LATYLRRAAVRAAGAAGWPFDLPAVVALPDIDLSAPATFFVGENGVGKSTLVEGLAMAAGINPHGGTRNIRTRGHGTESTLHEHLHLVWGRRRPKRDFFLRAETLLDTMAAYDRIGGTFAGLTRLSHGESVTGLLDRLPGRGLLLFADEPEDGVSVTGQLALLRRLHELMSEGAQLVIATHSPILPALPGSRTYELDDDGAHEISWDDTDAAVIMRSFFRAPDAYLARLLNSRD